MKPVDIFNLVVRLSGYLTVLYAFYLIVMGIIGPFPFTLSLFVMFVVYAVIGLGLMRLAPVLGAFAYADES